MGEAKTIIMPGTKEAKDTEKALENLSEADAAALVTVPMIGADKKPVAPKYVRAIRVCQDGKMEVEMISGQHYAIIDMVKANTLFHQNEAVMLTKIAELMKDGESHLHNMKLIEDKVKKLERQLKKQRRKS